MAQVSIDKSVTPAERRMEIGRIGPEWRRFEREQTDCRACSRLVGCRESAPWRAPPAHRGSRYWARPVPGFGDRAPRLLVIGLAPGAHGANRTGRPFTGDAAGSLVYAALCRARFASAARSEARGDGLVLRGARVTNAVRCAPPGNRPSSREIARCSRFLRREIDLCGRAPRAVLCLGSIAWRAALEAFRARGLAVPRPRPGFAHGAEADLGPQAPVLIASYHPSQLNVRTGRLTPAMFGRVVARAARLARRERRP
jgi:uracil-DNA glycosylase family 4